MSPSVTSQSFDKIRRLLFVALVTAQVFEHSRGSSLRFAISTSKALSRESVWIRRDCADQFFDGCHRTNRYRIFLRGFGSHKRDKSPRLKEIGCGGWI